MAENRVEAAQAAEHRTFKEAVCIDASRVYDSCCDKDCLEDLRVFFCNRAQPIIDSAISVKCRSAEIVNVFLDVEPVPFNRGFYSVDITYFIVVHLDAITNPCSAPIPVKGLCFFNKKVILFGSEGNVKVFTSDFVLNGNDEQIRPPISMPQASIEVVDPICLACKLVECPDTCHDSSFSAPHCITSLFDGDFDVSDPDKSVFVTLGLFSIVSLKRDVQMIIPAYDFCIPEKECIASTDDPCELFKKLRFPTDEFFPPRFGDPEESERPVGCCGGR